MSAENRLRIHNLWAKNRLSKTERFYVWHKVFWYHELNRTYLRLVCQHFRVRINWPLRQPQHCRKPFIILPHLRRNSNRRIFLGFKFLIPVFCSKLSKYFFGWLDLSKDFLGIFKTICRFAVVPAYPSQVVLRINRTKLSVLYYFIFSGDF